MRLTDFTVLMLSLVGAGCAGVSGLFSNAVPGVRPNLWQVLGAFFKWGIGGAALGNGFVDWFTANPTAMKKVCASWGIGAFPELKDRLIESYGKRPGP